MEFRVLGPLEVRDEGRELGLGGRKQRAVLARMLLEANQVVPVEELLEAVWGEAPPEGSRATLQVYLANLRKVLRPYATDDPRVLRRPPGYLLRVSDGELDLHQFRRLAAEGREASQMDPSRASAILRSALEHWRGAAFQDLAVDTVPPPQIAALEEERVGVLENRLEAELDSGLGAELVAELDALVAVFPLRERLHAQRMVALYRAGRQADALSAYRHARRILIEELGVEPGPDLQRLEQAVLAHDPALEAAVPAARARPALPTVPTTLIGRRTEVHELTVLLNHDRTRLVTLTGPGGIGKTRLALEVARSVQDRFTEGVFFIPLASVTDPRLLLPTIARVLKVKETRTRSLMQLLSDRLEDRPVLLVLDNFEHILAAAHQLADLLARTHRVKLMVTSRAAIRISAEHDYPVPPLPLPPALPGRPVSDLRQNDAVSLFADRAGMAMTASAPDEPAVLAIAGICRRLDGLPLAIELAAARMRVLTPQTILDRLDDRLRLLVGGSRDLPHRQRTLRATMEWSYGLLSPNEQRLFAQLSVFTGGWTLDAVEAVCGDQDLGERLDLLDGLIGHSLVSRTLLPGGTPRFFMLQTIREYALELLDDSGDAQPLRRRHAEFYLALAEAAAPCLDSARQLVWMDRLADEQDNLRAALAWATAADGDTEIALRLAAALWHFWEMTGALREGRRSLQAALAAGEHATADLLVHVYSGAGTLAWAEGDYESAQGLHTKALELARGMGDLSVEAFTLNNLGAGLVDRDDFDGAEGLCSAAATLAQQIGEDRIAGMALHNLGEIAFHRGEYESASRCYTDALRMVRPLGDRWLVSGALRGLAVIALRRADTERATSLLRESLALAAELGENYWIAEDLEALAAVAYQSSRAVQAARLLGAADTLRRRIGAPMQAAERPDHDRLLVELRTALGDPRFDRAWTGGAQLTTTAAVAEATVPRRPHIAALHHLNPRGAASALTNTQRRSETASTIDIGPPDTGLGDQHLHGQGRDCRP